MLEIIIIVLLLVNLFGFVLVAMDKRRAKKRMWRIPEKSFFIISALGGFPGVYTGLFIFRHKTKHIKFTIGLPLIFIIQLVILYYLFFAKKFQF
ncbi:MAG TPA: DUF1294 domain-containing protein [Clostridiaceae bacterium]|nr:DUF1294 domain-containing protein [Clostridiaceae bacterium]